MAEKKATRSRRQPVPHTTTGTQERAAVIPTQERTVDFYGDDIPVAQAEDGTLYVALRPITDFLGLYFSAQRRRTLRDEVLAARLRPVLMTAADGRQREQLCLPLDLLPGWLFGVTPSQARPEIMEKLNRYRAECFRVLWHAFAGDTRSVSAATVVIPTPRESVSLAHIEQMALAIAQMAREQRAFEEHVELQVTSLRSEVTEQHSEVMGRLDQAAAVVSTLLRRMTAVEGLVLSDQAISDAQAAEISALVKAIASELTEKEKIAGVKGRNPYQAVFGELYRRFRVSSYHNIPVRRYGEVMAWLRAYQETLDAHGDTSL